MAARLPRGSHGFSQAELLVATALVCILSAIAMPAFSSYYEKGCVMAAVSEIAAMIKEAKQSAFSNECSYAVGFDTASGKVSLISRRGRDSRWATADDQVVRSFCLADKGGGLRFGYGTYGPLPGLAATSDGTTFTNNNTLICNPDLTGTAGTVYLITRSGAAMAIVTNSTDFSYKLWRWDGKRWVRI